ncbi:TPA: hypothetical protein ACP642_003475 [Escherichia coli]|uniref:hypothetical protein n=1 Tax=Escherichia coli TaxID=562 RepID=UPI00039106D3|nr:hypothetical protein [Escherichia coli]EQS84159.1 hypothetical protein G822_02966 [Escherichia coli HVH 164 (4-5953081)]
MRNYPHPGERWQHERGWTVTIIRLIEASPSVALVNPEFSCEVLIRHDSDNQLSSCPLPDPSMIRDCQGSYTPAQHLRFQQRLNDINDIQE